MSETLKIKDLSYLYTFIIVVCIFPLVFMGIPGLVSNDHLIAFLITFCIYSISFVFFIKFLNKQENRFAIIANNEGVSFKGKGKFRWQDISSIDSFTKIERKLNGRYEAQYITVKLTSKTGFVLKTNSYDYQHTEIVEKLNRIGKLI